MCTVFKDPIPPCRSLCESAREGCEELLNRIGFDWPESLQCERFPERDEGICVGANRTESPPPRVMPTTTPAPTGTFRFKVTIRCFIVCLGNGVVPK